MMFCKLSKTLPDKVEELHALLKRWRRPTGALMSQELNLKYDEEIEWEAIRRFYSNQRT